MIEIQMRENANGKRAMGIHFDREEIEKALGDYAAKFADDSFGLLKVRLDAADEMNLTATVLLVEDAG
jgi:hypothetical protein